MKCSQCGFDNPGGFTFCSNCGARITVSEGQLTPAELDHLRAYLPSALVETLQFEPAALALDHGVPFTQISAGRPMYLPLIRR